MNPYLTSAGRSVLAAAILFIAVGTLSGIWGMLLIGLVMVGILAMAYHALLPAALVLERRLLSIEVTPPDSATVGTLRTLHPIKLGLRLHNRAGASLRGVVLEPHSGSGLELLEAVPSGIFMPGYSASETDMTLQAVETGRWFLHGFKITIRDMLGLVAVGEYVSTPTGLKFLPEAAVKNRSLGLRRNKVRDREGFHLVRQMGFGTNLRELRDHQPGDPFRSIAWKATARTRRLMVKDYESEQVLGCYMCLDVSSTMRGGKKDGQHGNNKLEHAVGLATGFARTVIADNDRVGLITFDEKIHGHLKPRDGRAHMRQILHHLIGVRHVVDDDLTEYNDLEVADLAARYLLIQERIDFRHHALRRKEVGPGKQGELRDLSGQAYDFDLLSDWVGSVLEEEEKRFDDPSLHVGVLGYQRLSPIRRFCHLRGIEIPYRVETRLGQKERGLVQCLEEILAHTRDSHLIFIITDLCGIMNTELIVRGLRLVQARRHKVVIASPFTPDYVHATAKGARSETLHELFTLAEVEERQAIIRTIETLGIPVVQVGPEDALPTIFRRLGRAMSRRR